MDTTPTATTTSASPTPASIISNPIPNPIPGPTVTATETSTNNCHRFLNATKPQTLSTLPYDLKQLILSALDAPRDLVSIGLASRGWGELVFPYHVEYRVLRVRSVSCGLGSSGPLGVSGGMKFGSTRLVKGSGGSEKGGGCSSRAKRSRKGDGRGEMWRHLAERKGLAGRIRSVIIGRSGPERCPTTLLHCAGGSASESSVSSSARIRIEETDLEHVRMEDVIRGAITMRNGNGKTKMKMKQEKKNKSRRRRMREDIGRAIANMEALTSFYWVVSGVDSAGSGLVQQSQPQVQPAASSDGADGGGEEEENLDENLEEDSDSDMEDEENKDTPEDDPTFAAREIFTSLQSLPSLKQVHIYDLGGRLFDVERHPEVGDLEYPLWQLKGLEALTIETASNPGIGFPRVVGTTPFDINLLSLLRANSGLEKLTLHTSMWSLDLFEKCYFPRLKSLWLPPAFLPPVSLPLVPGSTSSSSSSTSGRGVGPGDLEGGEEEVGGYAIKFISRHPTIEHLSWYFKELEPPPTSPISLTRKMKHNPPLLPNLKTILAFQDFIITYILSSPLLPASPTSTPTNTTTASSSSPPAKHFRPLIKIRNLFLNNETLSLLFLHRPALHTVRYLGIAGAVCFPLIGMLGHVVPSVEVVAVGVVGAGVMPLEEDEFVRCVGVLGKLRFMLYVTVVLGGGRGSVDGVVEESGWRRRKDFEAFGEKVKRACPSLEWVLVLAPDDDDDDEGERLHYFRVWIKDFEAEDGNELARGKERWEKIGDAKDVRKFCSRVDEELSVEFE